MRKREPDRAAAPPGSSSVFEKLTLVGITTAAIILLVGLARVRFFQLDEFVFVRAAWLISEGQVPYRDFFEHHTPLFYSLLAPSLAVLPQQAGALLAIRLLCLASAGLLAVSTYLLCRSLAGRFESWAATLLLFMMPGFVSRAIEIRPDVLAAAAFTGASALLIGRGWSASGLANAVPGALVALAILATQKSAQYAWGLLVVALLMTGQSLRARTFRPGPLLFFLAGFALPLLGLALVLVSLGAWDAFWNQNVELALRWQAADERFPFSRYLGVALRGSAIWGTATAIGILGLALGAPRGRSPRDSRLVRFVLIAAPASISLMLLPNPWPYNFLPVLAVLTPLAALGLGEAGSRLGAAGGRRAIAAVLALGLLLQVRWFVQERERDNSLQLQLVDRVLTLTTPDTAVFDDNGGYLFRPSAYFLWYHSKAMRILLRQQLERELIPELLRSAAPVWLMDQRFGELPANVREFVTAHYQPFLGPIHLWGVRLPRSAGAGETAHEATFLAIRDGGYFVTSAGLESGGSAEISIDGVVLQLDRPVELTAGEHRLRVDGAMPKEGMWVLWVPATGELWRPTPARGLSLYPYFF